jgi:hypothetical protein
MPRKIMYMSSIHRRSGQVTVNGKRSSPAGAPQGHGTPVAKYFGRLKEVSMEGPGRGCLAGLISWKLGGGLLSTIVIFVIAYIVLGHVHC